MYPGEAVVVIDQGPLVWVEQGGSHLPERVYIREGAVLSNVILL